MTDSPIWRFSRSQPNRRSPIGSPLEVSDIECRRAGLSDLKRCWIVVGEYNCDVAERSWYIEPDEPALGRFSKAFMMTVAAAFGEASRKSGRRVNRTE